MKSKTGIQWRFVDYGPAQFHVVSYRSAEEPEREASARRANEVRRSGAKARRCPLRRLAAAVRNGACGTVPAA